MRPATKSGLVRALWHNPARDWALLFLVIQALVNVDGLVNSYSRWCVMVALAESGTVRIDRYEQHTIDWSQTPDGHYYSNKAPGPALLGYPLFRAMDWFTTHGTKSRDERDQRRVEDRLTNLHVLSVATQAVPYALLVLLIIAALQDLGLPAYALHLAALGLFFANTGSLFMNTYFGHGMASVFLLATLLALHRNRPVLVGLSLGLAVLCDYSAALLLLPVLWTMGRLGQFHWRRLGALVVGGIAPAIAFCVYHYRCFGGPFTLPSKFQNPAFVDVAKDVPNVWGVLRLWPKSDVVFSLFFSHERGLVFTQPWVLVTLVLVPFLLWRRRGDVDKTRLFVRWIADFAVLGFVLLLGMNASFGGWHGGATPGPRYLSLAFPPLVLAMTCIYTRTSAFWQQTLFVAVAAALLPFVLLFSTTAILAQPDNALLPYLFNQLVSGPGKNLQRFALIVLGFAWVGWRALRAIREVDYVVAAQARGRSPHWLPLRGSCETCAGKCAMGGEMQ